MAYILGLVFYDHSFWAHLLLTCWMVISLVYKLSINVSAFNSSFLSFLSQNTSLVSLLRHLISRLLDRIPFWSYAKLILTCWLVIPQFSGAAYVYQHYVRPFFAGNRTVNIFYVPKKKDIFTPTQDDDILPSADKYIHEYVPDAFQETVLPVRSQHLSLFH